MTAEAKRYAAFCLLAVSFLAVFFLKAPDRIPFLGRAGRASDAAARPSVSSSATSTARNGATDLTAKPGPSQRAEAAHAAPARVVFPGFPVDINIAGRAELMMLPGIGEKTADRILERRLEKGRFGSAEELLDVKGIGPGKYERLRGLVTAGGGRKGAERTDRRASAPERE